MTDLFGRKRRRKEAELRERELVLAEKQADIADRKLKQQQKIIRMMQEENSKDMGKFVMVPLASGGTRIFVLGRNSIPAPERRVYAAAGAFKLLTNLRRAVLVPDPIRPPVKGSQKGFQFP